VDHNPSWPDPDLVTVNLGTALAGQAFRVRFHIGTDQAAGGAGWQLDDIGFTGLDNTPFARLVEKPSACGGAPADGGSAPDMGTAADGGEPAAGKGGGCGCVLGAAPGGGALLVAALAAGALGGARLRRRRG
jgi:hypothetical protein